MAEWEIKTQNATAQPSGGLVRGLRLTPKLWLALCASVCCTSLMAGENPLDNESVSANVPSMEARPTPGIDSVRRLLTIEITRPLDKTVLPPEMPPVTFRWNDRNPQSDRWIVEFQWNRSTNALRFETEKNEWMPSAKDWEFIKSQTRGFSTKVTISGVIRGQKLPLSSASMEFRIASIPVGAPIFFREVSLPFQEAARNPSGLRWRLGDVGNPDRAPVALENMPVCGNCHSFSKKEPAMAMDVDYPNKGAFFHDRIAPEMAMSGENIRSWQKTPLAGSTRISKPESGNNNDTLRAGAPVGNAAASKPTLGLLAQISPDGKWLVGTINDKSIVLSKGELAFSQLFLPVRGILAVYNLNTGEIAPLPGADDPQYVQTNPAWSPDGEYLVFARAKALDLENDGKPLASRRKSNEFLRSQEYSTPFRFDLCRIPFNGGHGGKVELLAGASQNGFSNYYPKYSPDGKWIAYCRASRHMMIQPDSELWILDASGGQTRRMEANTPGMNSWHSWSPNGRWLVFSSKALSPNTQLWLTHVDENGASSPAVCLDYLSDPEYAVNLPEFVPIPADGIARIQVSYAPELTWLKTGDRLLKEGKLEEAVNAFQKSLEAQSDSPEALQKLGLLYYYRLDRTGDGMALMDKAARLAPTNPFIQYDWGTMLLGQGRVDQAIESLQRSLSAMAETFENEYNPFDNRFKLGFLMSPRHAKGRLVNPLVDIQLALGRALYEKGEYAKSVQLLTSLAGGEGIRQADVHVLLAMAHQAAGDKKAADDAWEKAQRLNPALASQWRLAGSRGFRDALTKGKL